MSEYYMYGNYQTLKNALDDVYIVDDLKVLAKLICSKVPTRKAQIIDAISTEMLDNTKKVYNRLDKIERAAVLEAVYSANGKLDIKQFTAKYNSPISLGRSSYYDKKNGYLIDIFIINKMIPDDLQKKLKAFLKKPKKDSIKSIEKLPASVIIKPNTPERQVQARNTEVASLVNLETILRFIDAGKLKVSQTTKRPTTASMKNICNLLKDGDWYNEDEREKIGYIQPFAWPLIIQGAGLAKAEGANVKLTNTGKKTLNGKLPEAIKAAWKKWEKTKIIDEFCRIQIIKGQKSSRGKALVNPSNRRPIINEALTYLPPDKWITINEFIRYMNSQGLKLEVARYPWKLYISDPNYDNLNDYCWSIIEGRYVHVYLFEYAATLGLIDIAYVHPDGVFTDYDDPYGFMGNNFFSRYDGLKYIRLNKLGAYVLEMSDHYEAPEMKQKTILKVLPNHDIVVTDAISISPYDKFFLNKISKKVSSFLWQLTPKSILDAAENGTDVKEIIAFLKSRSSEKIPETVKILLEDSKKRSSSLKYSGKAHLIECKDPFLISLISSDSKLKKLCIPAGENHIVVLPGKEQSFNKILLDTGYIVPQFKDQI